MDRERQQAMIEPNSIENEIERDFRCEEMMVQIQIH